jgi:hypothetical protein
MPLTSENVPISGSPPNTLFPKNHIARVMVEHAKEADGKAQKDNFA